MSQIPVYLQDAKELLTREGFKANGVWYHGTSSALLKSIKKSGLKRSGDSAFNESVKSTMATIGNQYTQSAEPVFLTQSKELAYYWAEQTVHERGLRFEGKEKPVVLEVGLPQELASEVKTDVGARSLLLMETGERYLGHLAMIYQDAGFNGPHIDLMNADRMEFQDKLGMVYIDQNIPAEYVSPVKE